MFRRRAAYTITELLLTLAAAGILAGIAGPVLHDQVAAARGRSATNQLVAAIHLARSMAIRRAREVVICPAPDCAADARWNDGWLVFVNEDADRPPRRDDEETVLRRQSAMPGVSITANRGYFVIRRVGLRSTNGTLTVCDSRGAAHARAVIVSYTGRPRIARSRPDGDPLQC